MNKKKRTFRPLLGLCLGASLALSTASDCLATENTQSTQAATEDGHSSDTDQNTNTAVTEIRTVGDFLKFAENCRSDYWSLGRTVHLQADLDLSGQDFDGIPYFNGTFEGNGHRIVSFELTPKGSAYGFFRYIGESGKVQGLHLEGSIQPTGSQNQIGGLVGVNYGTVEHASFSGSVSGQDEVGALAGINKSTGKLISCTSDAVVSATNHTGGIAGKNAGLISGCISESSVNIEELETTLDLGGVDIGSLNLAQNMVTRNHTGGIAGSSEGIITDCKNKGTVGLKHTGYNVGGIAGKQSGLIAFSTNEGDVYGRKDVGGIVGQALPYVESEYMKDKVSQTREDISRLNQTINGISSAMRSTSAKTRQYADSLVNQYSASMDSVSGSLDALSQAVSRDYPQAQENVNRIREALQNIQAIQDSTEELSQEHLDVIAANLGIINDSLSGLQNILPDTTGSTQDLINNISGQLQDGTNRDNLASLIAAIDRQVSYIQNYLGVINGSAGEINDQLGSINENLGNFEGSFSDTGQAARNLAESASNQRKNQAMLNDVKNLADTLDSGMQSISDGIDSAAGQISHIADSISGDLDALMGDEAYVEDISSIETAENTDGVISGCVNHGNVNGDLNTGGIAGTMNVEYEADPEFDLDLTGAADITLRSTINNVLIRCANYGSVTAKKNCAGGITGLQELGFIYNAQSYGEIASDSGSYLGGIAGKSSATIQNGYSMCNISGADYTGGIAGSGCTIKDSISASSIESTGECSGSIAGALLEDGVAKDNYFVADGPGGIDHISYAGTAEPRSYEDIMAMEQTPDGFERVTVTFLAEDTVLSEKTVAYGGSLHREDYPTAPEKEGCYVVWPEEEILTDIDRNLTVTAEYIPWTESVASDETTENGKNLFLAVGEFYKDTKLHLTPAQGPELRTADSRIVYAYDWELTHNQDRHYETLEGHFYLPEESEHVGLWIQTDGTWSEAETRMDGSYLTASIPYGAPFALVALPADQSWMMYAAGGAALAVLAIFLFLRYRRRVARKKKAGKESHPS